MERILHFEGFYFSNRTLDMAVVNPNGFQARPGVPLLPPFARSPDLPCNAA